MPQQSVSYGKCFLCNETVAKNVMTRHLKKCLPAHDPPQAKRKERLFQIRAEGRYAPEYWLYLEMPAGATLPELDNFLRDIWLECCGHLSAFEIGGVSYELDAEEVDSMWADLFGPSARTVEMEGVRLEDVLQVGQTFHYEYDFGSTTHLTLKVVGEREGPRPKGGVRVLARNYAPDYRCVVCGEPAKWVYTYEGEAYCTSHAKQHEDWEEAFLPLVNSPRVGECAYTGPSRKSLVFEETLPAEREQG